MCQMRQTTPNTCIGGMGTSTRLIMPAAVLSMLNSAGLCMTSHREDDALWAAKSGIAHALQSRIQMQHVSYRVGGEQCGNHGRDQCVGLSHSRDQRNTADRHGAHGHGTDDDWREAPHDP